MNRLMLSVYLFSFAISNITAQQITFSKVFSNFPLNAENGWTIKEVKGGYLLLSAIDCFDNPNKTCLNLTKIDSIGNISWTKAYTLRPGFTPILEKDDKYYIAGGISYLNQRQFLLYCLDLNGNILWQKEYGDTNIDEYGPQLSFLGNNLNLTGERPRIVNGLNSLGLTRVEVSLGGELIKANDILTQYDVVEIASTSTDVQGNCLISFLYCPNLSDCVALEYFAGVALLNQSGEIEWQIDLPQLFPRNTLTAHQIGSNTIVAAWQSKNSTIPNSVKTPPAIYFADTLGVVFDTVVLNNQSYKTVFDVTPVWEQGIICAGTERIDFLAQINNAPNSGWLLRMDELGEILWQRNYYDTTYHGMAKKLDSAIPTKDGGYIACGTVDNLSTGVLESHNWVLKLDSMGCLIPGCGVVNYIVDAEEPIFLSGMNVKISPNPATSHLFVEIPELEASAQNINLYIYDVEGRIIKQSNINAAAFFISIQELKNGVYFAVFVKGNEIVASKKCIVLK
jgi:Secretion system C-terminal sorting domain